jgi:hypothetical protein
MILLSDCLEKFFKTVSFYSKTYLDSPKIPFLEDSQKLNSRSLTKSPDSVNLVFVNKIENGLKSAK